MRYRLLEFIECPYCHSEFSLTSFDNTNKITSTTDVDLGYLVCENYDLFPVVRGIPRLFIGSNKVFYDDLKPYLTDLKGNIKDILHKSIQESNEHLDKKFLHIQKSFSSQWSSTERKDSAWGRNIRQRKELFLNSFTISTSDLSGKTILDAGCGHGEVELALKNVDVEIFAVDLSYSVDYVKNQVYLEKKDTKSTFHFIQGNIHQLPFKSNSFDFVHSAGVLHHTPDTYKGFEKVTKLTKPGGLCFIELYSTDHMNILEKIIYRIHNWLRIITTKLPHSLLHSICITLAPLLWCYFEISRVLFKNNKYNKRKIGEIKLSLFDGLSPKYRFHHSTTEVMDWFIKNKFKDVKKTFYNHNGIGIVGTLRDLF